MRVAAVQMSSGSEKASNIAAADAHVRAAAADGATLVLLPEKWTAIGGGEILAAAAEDLGSAMLRGAGEAASGGQSSNVLGGVSGEGEAASSNVLGGVSGEGEAASSNVLGGVSGESSPPFAIDWARSIAAELRIDLVAGSITEREEGESRLFNTSLHIGPDGELKALYRKIHMFDVEVGGQVYRESEIERPGAKIVLTKTASGVEMGMSICYDVRFPELYRILAIKGARVILVPAAFTLTTTREHWEILLRARAIESQAFVIAANQFGEHPGGYHSGGRSMIVDPWGVVLAQAPDGEGHVVADLDLHELEDVRTKLPSLRNRRPDAYVWPDGEGAR